MLSNDFASSNSYGSGVTHYTHRITEFHPYQIMFWESGARSAVSSAGAGNDAANDPWDQGCLSIRHNPPGQYIDPSNATSMTGNLRGASTVGFIDGHAELWQLYQFQNALEQVGGPNGSSPLWCSPTWPQGGYEKGNGIPYSNVGHIIQNN